MLLLGLGLSVSLLGARSLGPNLTPGTEPLASGVLVERGAYRHVRHPVYLGLILVLAGWAWWFANGWLGLIAGLASFGYFDRKATAEERWLLRRFPAYREYQGRVPKLIPRLGPR
jgi:protein-S-isoprenylcysteine O-methyltransferase Ste14